MDCAPSLRMYMAFLLNLSVKLFVNHCRLGPVDHVILLVAWSVRADLLISVKLADFL